MLNIIIVPCLNDNYAYVCYNNKKDAFVVDPSEFKPVSHFIESNKLNLKFILNTHHHFDHVGGNYELKQKYNCKVIGSKLDRNRIPEVDILLKEGEKWKFKEDAAQIIEIPGHTTGHIAFYFSNQKIVFTGDTLFSLGCGRLFEGTPEMMWNSLQKLRNLPDDTKIYCGHEYTLNNALFTKSVIPGEVLKHIQETTVCSPIVKRHGKDLWIWKPPEPDGRYLVSADVARGDGEDYSAFHVLDLNTLEQVAEYRSKEDTTRYSGILMSIATEYNDALLVVENNNVGWAVLQVLIDRDYKNLFWMKKDLKYVDSKTQYTNKYRGENKYMVPGFTTSMKSKPLIIETLSKFIRESSVRINSIRLVDELFVFIFNNGKAEALKSYNDDLVMSLAIGLWVRETALRLYDDEMQMTRQTMEKIDSNVGVYKVEHQEDLGWEMPVGEEMESLTWLIGNKE